ncbi:MAG: outer membrane lipoprotein carrier protein LolA [Paludibacteraceae bacterium]|nr:outer membrane lipoprotein carrier protein LolA [Paludibacteraceae bacterium]
MNIKQTISLCLLLATAACTYAQTIEDNILKLNKQQTTYVAQFTEKIVMPKMKKETVKQGTMYFSAPDALLMKYSDPEGDYSLIKDGKFSAGRKGHVQNFPMNEKNKSQMYVLRETLLGSMTGDLKRVAEENEADIVCEEKAGKYICLLTKQKAKTVGVNRLELVYDKKSGALLSLKLLQANGNYTLYETKNIQQGTQIPADTWKM